MLRIPVLYGRAYGTRQESRPWRQRPNRKARLSLILQEDVHKLGVKGQIVTVKRGYGRNHLLPKKKAVYATPDNVRIHEAYVVEKGTKDGLSEIDFIADFLADKEVTVEQDPSVKKWKVREQEISTVLRKKLQLHVPLDCIELQEPLSSFDSYSVQVRLDNTLISLPVKIEPKIPKERIRKEAQAGFKDT